MTIMAQDANTGTSYNATSSPFVHELVAFTEHYRSHLKGNLEGRICLLSQGDPSSIIADALAKAFQALNLSDDELFYVDVHNLEHQDLIKICELLDPRIIIASNTSASALLLDAYSVFTRNPALAYNNQGLGEALSLSLFSRRCLLFAHLEGMLGTQQGKQHAWALLKQMKASF